MSYSSCLVAIPRLAGRRFRFQIAVAKDGRATARRQLAVAQELEDWVPMRILAEHINSRRHWVWVETRREVAVAAAKDFVKGLPGYVPKSFRMLDAAPAHTVNGRQRAR